MPITELRSLRLKKELGEPLGNYTYDDLPHPLRVQITQILAQYFTEGGGEIYFYPLIVETLRHEYGVLELAPDMSPFEKVKFSKHYEYELNAFLIAETDIEKVLDAVELSFGVLDKEFRDGYPQIAETDAAIKNLNYRFKQHGLGYQYCSHHIIRMDTEFTHTEVVEPALRLLAQSGYVGAQEEFLKAHEMYRKGETKDALNNALKAFESVMKTICTLRGWSVDKHATAALLLTVCFDNGLIEPYWKQHYTSLRNLLESGVPTVRNKLGAHGQGAQPVTVPAHLVAYMLHMTAAAIVFFAEAEKALT